MADLQHPDLSKPNPGPRPEEERLTNDEVLAKYGADLVDADIREQILSEMVASRKLSIAAGRKWKIEHDADAAWLTAYVQYYGTDEG